MEFVCTRVIIFYLEIHIFVFIFRPTSLHLCVIRIFATNYIFREDVLFLPSLIHAVRAVDFLDARLCLMGAFFQLAFHSCSLSFRSRFALCATFYTLSRFFRRFFKSPRLVPTEMPVFVVSFYQQSVSSSLSVSQHAPSLSCLYTHFFVSPLSPDSPSIFHLLDLTSPRFSLHGSVSVSPLCHCPFPSRLNRCKYLSSISLFAPPLPSTLFSLFIYHSPRPLPLSYSLFLS